MKGIELSRQFYKIYGKKILSEFEEIQDRIAIGIFGNGSECFGFDDDISLDHDVSVGFTMLLTNEDENEYGFDLGRLYHKAVKEYIKCVPHAKYSVDKFGVFTIDEYFERLIGFSRIPLDYKPWLYTPEYAFAEATNGEIFEDKLGIVTDFRKELISEYPEDVRLKKLAGHLAMMAQTGQYNYYRMHQRNDKSTVLCLSGFVEHTLASLFLLEERFMPYYKWQFKALEQGNFGYLADDLYKLLSTDDNFEEKKEIIEKISKIVINELYNKGYSESKSDYLEDHAIEVQNHIKNRQIRALHLMEYGK